MTIIREIFINMEQIKSQFLLIYKQCIFRLSFDFDLWFQIVKIKLRYLIKR